MREFKLKRTLPEGTARNVFHEVRHSEDLQLRNPNHLRMFYLDISTTKFSYASLKDFLLDCVGWYFYDRSAIKKLNDEGHGNSISTRAMRRMLSKGKPDQKGTGSELGEILLYAFLEDVLGAPKLMTKVELTSLNDVHSDAVHLLPMPGDDEYFQMVFGTSHIVNDLGDAVENAFTALKAILDGEDDEAKIVSASFLDQHFEDKKLEDYLISILKPSEEKGKLPEPAFGLFLGYSIDLDKTKYSNREYEEKVIQKIEMDIRSVVNDIREKISQLGMDDHSFYIYVLPFDEAEKDKKAIMKELLMGGE